jgi:choline kinase
MSKKISPELFHGTYIGITIFSRAIHARFLDKMNAMISAGRVNDFFNVAVQELVDEGVQVGYTNTNGLAWAEIDDPTDLSFAQQNVFPQLATAQA